MKQILAGTLIVVIGLFLMSASTVIAQEPCEGNLDCDYPPDVDADDLTIFLEDFGSEPSWNPCPTCTKNCGPIQAGYPFCMYNDDCLGGEDCCCCVSEMNPYEGVCAARYQCEYNLYMNCRF